MSPKRKKPIRLLVVDDHKYFRDSLVGFLSEDPGIEIIGEAEDGLEAEEKTYALSPDIIVMDIKMPNLNGTDAAKRIKRALPEIKIILYSMYAYEFGSAEDRAAIDRFIPKQRLFEELFQAVHELSFKLKMRYQPA